MLKDLRIKNFTIIDDLSIGFGPGLNILTGETGAGKSIIVDALGLLLGGRASQDMIKTGRKEGHIEAFLDNTDHPLLKELSIESDEGIILRRTITSQGKGRTYINDTPVSMQTLSSIGRELIDIHGQHEHQGLLKKENHMFFIDTYGILHESVAAVHLLHNEIAVLRNTITAMRDRMLERAQRIEFLRFQIGEIDSARLKEGEKAIIEEERAILLNLSKLKESSETAYDLLYDAEGSSLEKLTSVISKIGDIAQIDRDAFEIFKNLESAVPLIKDAAILLRNLKDKYDIDPQKLGELDERLEVIKRLEKKYGEGEGSILAYRNKASQELDNLEHIEEQLDGLESSLASRQESLTSAAEELSKTRHAVSQELEPIIIGELKELGFQKAVFVIDIKKKEAIAATGMDDVEFLFSANPGETPKPLIKVASGGELSRIMLALKCVEINHQSEKKKAPLQNTELRTLIFDEVDAGIGGATAQHVAKRLKNIAASSQVLCITHLPQIAALADHHLKVEKILDDSKTLVMVTVLSGKERRNEIARMLSGRITEGSIKHAGELLGVDIVDQL
jgi:DNA repair protein RecN (Recombination protein N)